ncbi:protein Dok-7-like, partial [Lingula anatina]|uniref:Protein Dok-7-like n=1 Tax=Lingula anatina TaxID=7574 RepID=A0A1S3HG56_LINAN
MADSNVIEEGPVRFRDGKKWKQRWCVLKKLSPVADRLHISLYKDSNDRYKSGQEKATHSLEDFLGTETGLCIEREQHTMSVICQSQVLTFAFNNEETVIQWENKIKTHLGQGKNFLTQLVKAPPGSKLSIGCPYTIHIQGQKLCVTSGSPPKLYQTWQLSDIRRFGTVEDKFVFEGGSRCGKGAGIHAFSSDSASEITQILNAASYGQLQAAKRKTTLLRSRLSLPAMFQAYRSSNTQATSPHAKNFENTQVNADLNFRSHHQLHSRQLSLHQIDEKQCLVSIENLGRRGQGRQTADNAGFDSDQEQSHGGRTLQRTLSSTLPRSQRLAGRQSSSPDGQFDQSYLNVDLFGAGPTKNCWGATGGATSDMSTRRTGNNKTSIHLLDDIFTNLPHPKVPMSKSNEDPVFATVQFSNFMPSS